MAIDWTEIARFFVCGIPKPQPRPRARVMLIRRKPVPQIYNPADADDWKRAVAHYGRHVQPRTKIVGPVRLDIQFHFPRPQRLLKRDSPAGVILHTSRPDVDNLFKSTCDAMTDAGWWGDDAQIAAGEVVKFYARLGGQPGAWVVVSKLVTGQTNLFAEDAA